MNKHNLSRRDFLRMGAMMAAGATLVACAGLPAAFAQQKFSKTYRTPRRNIRLQLTNRSGTIEIEGWARES